MCGRLSGGDPAADNAVFLPKKCVFENERKGSISKTNISEGINSYAKVDSRPLENRKSLRKDSFPQYLHPYMQSQWKTNEISWQGRDTFNVKINTHLDNGAEPVKDDVAAERHGSRKTTHTAIPVLWLQTHVPMRAKFCKPLFDKPHGVGQSQQEHRLRPSDFG